MTHIKTTVTKALLALTMSVLLVGCSTTTDPGTPRYNVWVPPTAGEAVVSITLLKDPIRLRDVCGLLLESRNDYLGCSATIRRDDGKMICKIYAYAPTDFNDGARLAIIGHELLHCYGAAHESYAN